MRPGLYVKVEDNAAAVARAFGELGRRQLPFATAVALTRLAQQAQESVRKAMPSRFTIRSQRVVQGIRITRAEKRDWPAPRALVGTKDAFMAEHETGAWRRMPGKRVAVPTRLIKRTPSGAIRKADRPRALTRSGKGRVIEEGGRKGLVLASLKRRRGRVRRLGTGVLWLLRRRVRIRPRWGFRATVQVTAQARYAVVFRRELELAVRSARVRAGSFSPEQGRAAYLAAGKRIG